MNIEEAPGTSIARAAKALRGMDTSSGPDGGNNACVWSVNKILNASGRRPPWGDSVLRVSKAKEVLDAGAGVLLDRPEPGAIAIMQDNHPTEPYPHIGVVGEDGRSILSNSSSQGRLSWEAPEEGYTSYYGRKPLYYRLR